MLELILLVAAFVLLAVAAWLNNSRVAYAGLAVLVLTAWLIPAI